MIDKLVLIANYLKTRYQHKGHGGWNVYEDDKIKISYDTYYPNLYVYIFIDGKEICVLNHSGHGYTEEHHPGKWEQYVNEILYPKAIDAKIQKDLAHEVAKKAAHFEKFGPIDDSKLFTV